MARLSWFVMMLLPLAMGECISGCGPSTPSIQTVVQQAVETQTLSILSQVDWKQVMTAIEGKVGPNFRLVAEGYIKQTAGVEFIVQGGEISFRTQATGTGGRDNSALVPELSRVLTRWENVDSLTTAQKNQLAKEVADAIIDHIKAKDTATQPSP